jgi:hypothetical protein
MCRLKLVIILSDRQTLWEMIRLCNYDEKEEWSGRWSRVIGILI